MSAEDFTMLEEAVGEELMGASPQPRPAIGMGDGHFILGTLPHLAPQPDDEFAIVDHSLCRVVDALPRCGSDRVRSSSDGWIENVADPTSHLSRFSDGDWSSWDAPSPADGPRRTRATAAPAGSWAQVDASAAEAQSPFVHHHNPRLGVLAFELFISLVVILGTSSAPGDYPALDSQSLAYAVAGVYGVEIHPRAPHPPLAARWEWITHVAASPVERFRFCCYFCRPSVTCHAQVLSGAIHWLRVRSMLTRPPELKAGDWLLADILQAWPLDVARELADFSWPLRSVAEFRRLLRCQHASPVAIVGCEFTAAVRDSYSRAHGRVAISVDMRTSLVPGPHAVLDLADVLMLKVWLDAFLFPPCTHQVLSDTRAGTAKRLDGRSFWGIAFFIFCWCVVAHRVRVEQPNTIIPAFLFHPTQRFRPCDLGDADNKPINLYERGWGMLPLLDEPVPATTDHRRLTDFPDADARDRWRSSWSRFPHVCAAIVALTPEQQEADASLVTSWRTAGEAGRPCEQDDENAVRGLAPPDGPQPCFRELMESFAVRWYSAGLPVPASYDCGDPRPSTAEDRAYQLRRGVGDRGRLAGVVPISLRATSPSPEASTITSSGMPPLVVSNPAVLHAPSFRTSLVDSCHAAALSRGLAAFSLMRLASRHLDPPWADDCHAAVPSLILLANTSTRQAALVLRPNRGPCCFTVF